MAKLDDACAADRMLRLTAEQLPDHLEAKDVPVRIPPPGAQ
ncbi:MAG: hypothetical protein ABSB54_07195 [Acidimicrobiales bacterium]